MSTKGRASDWKKSLVEVLRIHNNLRSNGTVASFKTQDKRATVLFQAFTRLREMNIRLDSVRQFKGKHVEMLIADWLQQKLSASTIQNRLSVVRQFSTWIGKAGMVLPSHRYSPLARRSSNNTVDRSWSGKGVDPAAMIERARAIDPLIACQLALQKSFGLRPLEARRLRPLLADKGHYLDVNVGTKGNRARTVQITTAEQREVLEQAKSFASNLTDSMCGVGTLKQAEGRYYRLLAKIGLTRKQSGLTSYASRYEYANDLYKGQAGVDSPIRGGGPVGLELDEWARTIVSESLGHSRISISNYYLSARPRKQ